MNPNVNNYPLANTEKYLTIEQFIASMAMKKGIALPAGRLKPVAAELFVRAKYAAGGTSNLLSGNKTREVGVTNFDGNKLEDARFFAASAITVSYGEGSASKAVYEIGYDTKLPPVLVASNLVVRQNGMPIISLPISAIVNARKTEGYYRKLDSLVLLEPNQNIEVLIESPVGSSITPSSGDTSFVEVLIQGFETILR